MQDLTPDLTSNGAAAMAISAANQVVGYYYPNGSKQAIGFTWTQAGGRQDLGSNGTLPLAINDAGTVVGQATNAAGFRHAFSWTQSGGMKDLGTLGGAQSTALGINNKGWIVGTSMTGTGRGLLHAFLWTPAGGMQDLVTLAGLSPALQAYSVQINDSGLIALSTNNSLTALFPIMNLTIASSKNPSKAGEPVTFTATMSSFAGPPPDGDTVQFLAGSQLLGTGTFSNGVAQVTTTALRVGSRSVIAKFLGDANYLQAKSPVLTQVVNP
jgi:probable HAF family extracellular repeat protein